MFGFGPIQRKIRWAFIAKPGAELTTADLARWCYPTLQGEPRRNHRMAIRRAAERVAERAGVGWRGSIIWREKQSQTLPKLRENPAISENTESKQSVRKRDL
jgi:hypothetical protein